MPSHVCSEEVDQVIQNARQNALAEHVIQVNGFNVRSPFPSPEDWRDRWIYFLLVDRWNHPTSSPVAADPYLPYQGGNFAGIKSRLNYLRDLGVGSIWLSPVLMNPPKFGDYYGGYATLDFMRIEPRFCKDPAAALADPAVGDAEFRDLVDAVHAAGMHVVLDIVLNHVGDLFNYDGALDSAPWRGHGSEYNIYWRDPENQPHGEFTDVAKIPHLPREAGVWPAELQRNDYFRRRGDVEGSPDPTRGDFGRLKELVTEYLSENGTYPVRKHLIRAYQYLIARFDLDGFRVDTLMYVERDFARIFANAMREFALSVGKRNFFTFGEVWKDDDESTIAAYVGRDSRTDGSSPIIGFDAALDFPLRKRLEEVCKGVRAPADLALHLDHRREVQKTVLSSHGDVGAFFVTFLENHDLPYRYAASTRDEQVSLALTCLYTLQGIPCLYYGMEQGMEQSGDNREHARYCLWRDPHVFTRIPQHPRYQTVKDLAALRVAHPALRYGRQYFRQLTGNGINFGYSNLPGGILAYSRVLDDTEILVVANTNQGQPVPVKVVVDRQLHIPGHLSRLLYTNLGNAGVAQPASVQLASGCAVVPVSLRPMEVQVIGF